MQDWEGTEVVGVPVQTQTYPLSEVGTPPSDYASVRDSPRWGDHYSQGDSSHVEHSQVCHQIFWCWIWAARCGALITGYGLSGSM